MLKLSAYGISEMKRRNPPIAERGTHKIRLSENMSQEDLQLLKGPQGHQSAWVEEVPVDKTLKSSPSNMAFPAKNQTSKKSDDK